MYRTLVGNLERGIDADVLDLYRRPFIEPAFLSLPGVS